MKKKTLHLTLHQKAFEVMVTGEKTKEFRKFSQWIKSRLIDSKTGKPKEYDVVRFAKGYGNDKPYFIAEYKHFIQYESDISICKQYSNGLNIVMMEKNDFEIDLGDVIEKGNLQLSTKDFEEYCDSIIENGWKPSYLDDQSCSCHVSNPPCSFCDFGDDYEDDIMEEFNIEIIE